MKVFKTIVISLLLLQSFLASSQSSGDSLFDNSFVHTIDITFYEPNFWDTLTVYYNEIYGMGGLPTGPKKYLPAQISIDGVSYDTVGIRQKGFFSNWGVFTGDKKPLKVDMNEFVSGQKYDGLKKFNLNNGFEDPSMMRELVALDLMRTAGIKAPRVAYANVYLNGTHWGLYILMEQVDKTFLTENFSNGNGNLYKCIGNSNLEWQGSMDTAYHDEFELKTNEDVNDWSDFIQFLRVINKIGMTDADYVDSLHLIFNVKDYYRVLAIDILINNWDSYYDHGRNFYIYHNPDDNKFHWIPWDYNLSFADFGADILIQNIIGGPPPLNQPKPLIENILDIDSLKTQYLNAYCDMMFYNFTSTRIDPIIDTIQNMLDTHHLASTSEFFTHAEFIQNGTSDVMGGFGFYLGLKNMITTRTTEVTNELTQLNHSCDSLTYAAFGDVVINELMASNDSTSAVADQDGEYDDWIELYNNTNDPVDLSGYYLTDDFNAPAKWAIPDTTIAPNGYLVIWADKDATQTGLHANFRLSKDGEQIMLSAPNGIMIDSVIFGQQQALYSYARLPNGTGNFSIAEITIGSFNTAVNTQQLPQIAVNIYPNPASRQVTIDLGEQGKVSNISLRNALGQVILEQSVNVFDNRLHLNVNQVPTGLYFVVFKMTDKQAFTKKLMIVD